MQKYINRFVTLTIIAIVINGSWGFISNLLGSVVGAIPILGDILDGHDILSGDMLNSVVLLTLLAYCDARGFIFQRGSRTTDVQAFFLRCLAEGIFTLVVKSALDWALRTWPWLVWVELVLFVILFISALHDGILALEVFRGLFVRLILYAIAAAIFRIDLLIAWIGQEQFDLILRLVTTAAVYIVGFFLLATAGM